MWLKKFFVGVLLVCGVFSYGLMADENNQSKEYSFLKFFQDSKTTGDVATAIFKVGGYLQLDEEIIDAMLSSQVELYKGTSRAYNNNLSTWSVESLSSIKKAKKDLLEIIEKKDTSYHDIQTKFSNYFGTGIDILGVGLDAYDLGQNLNKLWDNAGNPNIEAWKYNAPHKPNHLNQLFYSK